MYWPLYLCNGCFVRVSLPVGTHIGIDVAEIALVMQEGPSSWNSVLLVILDLVVACVLVVPWVIKTFKASLHNCQIL